eukprot:366229-Chlamydomonas_euryale.AAC.8
MHVVRLPLVKRMAVLRVNVSVVEYPRQPGRPGCGEHTHVVLGWLDAIATPIVSVLRYPYLKNSRAFR